MNKHRYHFSVKERVFIRSFQTNIFFFSRNNFWHLNLKQDLFVFILLFACRLLLFVACAAIFWAFLAFSIRIDLKYTTSLLTFVILSINYFYCKIKFHLIQYVCFQYFDHLNALFLCCEIFTTISLDYHCTLVPKLTEYQFWPSFQRKNV